MQNKNVSDPAIMTESSHIPPAAFEGLPPAPGAFIVGGCLRDLLLQRTPKDYDIVCLAHVRRFAERVAAGTGGHLVALGKPGKRVYRIITADRTFDVVAAVGTSVEADLRRRDFTVNAMACELRSGRIIDIAGSRRDLQARCIRMVSESAFEKDPLRLLRAYRIAAMLDFDIEHRTAAAIGRHASKMAAAAAERIRDELCKLFSTPRASRHLSQMAQSGLVFEIIPALRDLVGCRQNRHHRYDVWRHTLAACRELEHMLSAPSGLAPGLRRAVALVQRTPDAWLLKFSLLLHDIAKPAVRSGSADRNVHFFGHAGKGAALAGKIAAGLRFSAAECSRIAFLVDNHMRPLQLFLLQVRRELTDRALARFYLHCGRSTPALLLLSLADHFGKDSRRYRTAGDFQDFAADLAQRYFTEIAPRMRQAPLITGRDLIHGLGLSPSPLFRIILDGVNQARLIGSVTDHRAAMDLARKIAFSAEKPEGV